MRTSSAFSADASLFPVWDARVLFPEFDTMLDLDVVPHAPDLQIVRHTLQTMNELERMQR